MRASPDPPAPLRPLIVTRDGSVLDELLQLAAAAGVTPDVAHDVGAARRAWSRAALVLVGDDQSAALGAASLPRRDGVAVVGLDQLDARVWSRAVALGAEQVLVLPDARPHLVTLLGDCAEGVADGSCVSVVGGCGGAGTSVLAAGLALTSAARDRPTLIVDADPAGGGIDTALGADDATGLHWDDVAATSGRLSATSLRESLPRVGALSLLTWQRGRSESLSPEAMRSVLAAGRRGHDLVVVDLPRHLDAAAEEAVLRSDLTLLLVPARVRATASAGLVLQRLLALGAEVGLVVVGTGAGSLDAELVAESLGCTLLAEMSVERGLDEALDHGLGPLSRRRGPLRATCLDLLAVLVSRGGAA